MIAIAALSLALVVVWLCLPGWNHEKIFGIIGDAMLFLAMAISYKAERKKEVEKKVEIDKMEMEMEEVEKKKKN